MVELCWKLFGSVGNFVDGVEYFSKKVFNDVIKLKVSTGVGIFLRKSNCQTGSEK